MDIQDTTKGMTNMIDRYRRIRRDDQGQADESGFTLIELLIVIVVIGILAAVTVFSLTGVTGQSLTSACHADVKSVAVAVEAFHAQSPDKYPGTVDELVTPLVAGGNKYLRSLPGNTTKYAISVTATGQVMVTTLATGAGKDANGNLVPGSGTPVDGENYAPAVDPCIKL